MSDILEAAARALSYRARFYSDEETLEAAKIVLAAVTPLIRAAALEEAAQVAEDYPHNGEMLSWACERIASAIRALKEQPTSM